MWGPLKDILMISPSHSAKPILGSKLVCHQARKRLAKVDTHPPSPKLTTPPGLFNGVHRYRSLVFVTFLSKQSQPLNVKDMKLLPLLIALLALCHYTLGALPSSPLKVIYIDLDPNWNQPADVVSQAVDAGVLCSSTPLPPVFL